MTENELATCRLMDSIQRRYFPELEGKLGYTVQKDEEIDGVYAQARFGIMEIVLYYSDDKVLSYQYRAGLIPIIAHEMAHYINPVSPEAELRKRLPPEMVQLWEELLEAGYAKCSMDSPMQGS